jgi:hypothetical protein
MATESARDDPDAAALRELERSAAHRRAADLKLSMNERLAALHHLCLQMSQIRGVARPRH